MVLSKDDWSSAEVSSIAPSQADTLVSDGPAQAFNAIGRPQPAYKSSGWANLPAGGFVANAPQFLPHAFTDESIIPVPVTLQTTEEPPKKKASMLSRIKSRVTSKERPMAVVKMPRRDYQRYFARNEANEYIGTEPERTWTKSDLEEMFGQYQNLPPTKWVVNVPSGLQ